MPEAYVRRGADLAPNQINKPNANTIRVDSDDELLKFGTGASGVTEKTVVTEGSTQTLTAKSLTSPTVTGDASSGIVVCKRILFTEDATSLTHTASVVLPANAALLDIIVSGGVLWTATGAVTLIVGDTADDDGYFTAVDLKATDLLVGETLAISGSNVAASGGKQGAYLVAATGRRGAVASNFGAHNTAGTTIQAKVTVVTPATAVGRTYVDVFYAVGQSVTVTLA